MDPVYTARRFFRSCNSVLIYVAPRGFDLISDALPFGRLWYGEPDAVASAIDYAGAIVEISTTGEVAEPVK